MLPVDLAGRRARLIAAALAALLLVAVGYAAGRLTPTFSAPGDASAEAGFARDMTVHHAQAVHMSIVEYDRGENSSVRRMAYDVATVQQYQMGVMEGWLHEWGLPLTTDRDPMSWISSGKRMMQSDGRMPGLASRDEIKQLEQASGRAADILYCQLLLRHHLGGIHMLDEVLRAADDHEVTELATAMRNSQQGEIEALRLSLKSLGADPV